MLSAAEPLIAAGVAVHWLHRRSKRPVGDGWQTAPVHTLETLKAAYRSGCNLGIRPGEHSRTPGGYLHLIDLDIRKPELADEAWACLLAKWPEARSAPYVISGSGGESRHIYLLTDRPLRSVTFGRSDGREMVFDPKKGRDVQKWDWECGLYGAPKQAVLPPSVHPDTGARYEWGRPLDWDLLEMGIGPMVSADLIDTWGAREDDLSLDDDDDLMAMVRSSPMGLSEEEIDGILADIPNQDLHHDEYVQVGMALHHEYEGSQLGFEKWCAWAKQSSKFDVKTQKTKWKSFRENKRSVVRMATLIKIAGENRLPAVVPAPEGCLDDLADLMGAPSAAPTQDALPRDWKSWLQITDDGAITRTLHNVEVIIGHDPRTRSVVGFNDFTQELVQVAEPGRYALSKPGPKPIRQLEGPIWRLRDPVNGDLWTQTQDNAVRAVLETPNRQGGYSLKTSDRDLSAALDAVARRNAFHPVRDYLNRLQWDGRPRVATLWIDYLGASDDAYHRETALLFMLAAVTRVFEPGHKFDFVPILEGFQGKRKSTFIAILARHWFAELEGDFHDTKAMVEKMQGSWILEIPELQGFSKAEVTTIKGFITRTADKVRLAYDRRAKEFPRQCVFIGSTNDAEYLRDSTGGRRFWPIACRAKEIDTDLLRANVDQLWAEALVLYREWRTKAGSDATLPLYLRNDDAAAEAARLQESRRQQDAADVMAGEIEEWLDQPIGSELGNIDDAGPPVYRNEICAAMLANELYGLDRRQMTQRELQLFGHAIRKVPGWSEQGQRRFEKYGKQRLFVRDVRK